MGHASKKKQAVAAQKRARPELIVLMEEALSFLRSSSSAFDSGFEAEAKRLSVTLRVLLHDTANSHSLLQQLGLKERLDWLDTAVPINPNNLLPTPGLLLMEMTAGEGVKYVPPLGTRPEELTGGRKAFAGWWSNPVLKVDAITWSRRQLVLALANKEGGAHVDPNLNQAYEALASQNALGFEYVAAEGSAPAVGNAVAVAVRQISYEVLTTCEEQLPALH